MSSLFKITDAPINSGDLYEKVRADADGAVVSFAGVVRDHSNGVETSYLEYEAYAAMAEQEMEKIGAAAIERWKVDKIAMVHRVGRLEVGEISVLIAVSSAHRSPAFQACSYAIDRLKASVPIWKKETTVDGDCWVEGPAISQVSG